MSGGILGLVMDADGGLTMDKYVNCRELRKIMYHQAFETDTPLQRWDSGCWIRYKMFEDVIDSIPAADVLPRDEAIRMGAELAAMHGSDATSQQLEEAYLKGVEDGMTRRDVRPAVKAHWYWDKDGMDWGIGAWRCSACKAMSPMWWNCDRGSPMHKSGHKFCPNCGAMMEES